MCILVTQGPLILSHLHLVGADYQRALPTWSSNLPIYNEALLSLGTLAAVYSLVTRLHSHVACHPCMLERSVGLSSHIGHFCALTKVWITFRISYFIHLFIAHDAASEYAVGCFFTSVKDLSFVSLMHALRWVITCTNIHIRLCCLSRSHVVEHDLSLCISTSLFVQCSLIDSSRHLSGTSYEVTVLNLHSSHIGRILPPMGALSSSLNLSEYFLGTIGLLKLLPVNISIASHSFVKA